MAPISRRGFLRGVGAAGAAMVLPPARVLGANGDLRIAILGVGGRGGGWMRDFNRQAGARVVAICDPDNAVITRRKAEFAKAFPDAKLATYRDYREVLDSPDVDAVCITTPNHWHGLLTIQACQAKKDVYVEKPCSHTVWEGRKMVEAAHKYERVVQAGTQNRSDKGLMPFYAWLKEGQIGRVTSLRGLCYRDRSGIGKRATPLTPPTEVDYNLWLGPAQDQPILRNRFHYDWHWVWNTGNGDIGNQGPHETDLLCWALGDPGLPNRVLSFGGRFGWDDAGETPNMQFAVYDFGGVPAFFEVRNLQTAPGKKEMPRYKGVGVGVVIECEGGYFAGGRGGGKVYDRDGKQLKAFPGDGGGGHAANWIAACHARKTADLRAPIDQSHPSSAVSHVANIAYRLGQKLSPGELKERMSADPAATEAIGRFSDQLAAWNVDFAKTPWTLGPVLTIDPKTERFTGNVLVDEANALLHRQDRAPFIVPQEV